MVANSREMEKKTDYSCALTHFLTLLEISTVEILHERISFPHSYLLISKLYAKVF